MEKLIINQTSNEVSEIYREAVQTHQRILANGEICAQSLLEICKDLKKMRDQKLYEEFGYSSFEEYTEKAVSIKPRQAYTYISTYERLGSTVLQSNANLGITKLDLIAQMNPVERTEKLAENAFDGMSVSEIKALVQKSKNQGEQISLLQTALEEAKAQNKAAEEPDEEKEAMLAHIAALKKEITDSASKLEAEKRDIVEKAKSEGIKTAKKEALIEAKKSVKENTERLTQKIKDLETALTEAGVEHDKLEKQLSLADSESAKAMVYIQNIQDNFNSLFAAMGKMPDEQKSKFNSACLKLLEAMRRQVEE